MAWSTAFLPTLFSCGSHSRAESESEKHITTFIIYHVSLSVEMNVSVQWVALQMEWVKRGCRGGKEGGREGGKEEGMREEEEGGREGDGGKVWVYPGVDSHWSSLSIATRVF